MNVVPKKEDLISQMSVSFAAHSLASSRFSILFDGRLSSESHGASVRVPSFLTQTTSGTRIDSRAFLRGRNAGSLMQTVRGVSVA